LQTGGGAASFSVTTEDGYANMETHPPQNYGEQGEDRMNATLCDRLKVWQQLADSPDSSASRETVLREIVEEVLRSRCLCRPRPGSELSGVYQSLYNAAESRLIDHLRATLSRLNFNRINLPDWTRENCNSAFREILDNEALQKLANAARSENWCKPSNFRGACVVPIGKSFRPSFTSCFTMRQSIKPSFTFVEKSISTIQGDRKSL
jgi:uncharacterized Fe-S cluster-containing protein